MSKAYDMMYERISERMLSGQDFASSAAIEGITLSEALRALESGAIEAGRIRGGKKPRKGHSGAYRLYTSFVNAKSSVVVNDDGNDD